MGWEKWRGRGNVWLVCAWSWPESACTAFLSVGYWRICATHTAHGMVMLGCPAQWLSSPRPGERVRESVANAVLSKPGLVNSLYEHYHALVAMAGRSRAQGRVGSWVA